MITTENFNNISFDYSLSTIQGEQKTVILLEGLPTTSKKHQLMFDLNAVGYDVFYPQYEGTRDSQGEFLARNPVEPINEFISALHQGIPLEDAITYKTECIYILGSSFGGGIALSLTNQEYIKKVVALSPVISFKLTKGIETLEPYISANHSNSYRYKKEHWNTLINDEFFCALTNTTIPSEKIMIIAGTQDEEILQSDLKDYTRNLNIELVNLEHKGHLTLSKIDESMINSIHKFFTK